MGEIITITIDGDKKEHKELADEIRSELRSAGTSAYIRDVYFDEYGSYGDLPEIESERHYLQGSEIRAIGAAATVDLLTS